MVGAGSRHDQVVRARIDIPSRFGVAFASLTGHRRRVGNRVEELIAGIEIGERSPIECDLDSCGFAGVQSDLREAFQFPYWPVQ